MDFGGRVALVTGAGGGIGLATARELLRRGASVIGVDRDPDLLSSVAASDPDVWWVQADVSREDEQVAVFDSVLARFGRVDAAVLNAGIEGRLGRIAELPIDEFDRVMSVNLRGVWIGLAQVLPVMERQRHGAVVVVSSTGGLRGSAGLAPYAASKHAVVGLAKSAALEYGRHGVRVNVVHPGPTRTPMMEGIHAEAAAVGRPVSTIGRIPLGRAADPAETARVIAFLCSDDSSFCTGASYLVDGGVMAGNPLQDDASSVGETVP